MLHFRARRHAAAAASAAPPRGPAPLPPPHHLAGPSARRRRRGRDRPLPRELPMLQPDGGVRIHRPPRLTRAIARIHAGDDRTAICTPSAL